MKPEPAIVPFLAAVFCVDCRAVSNSPGDQCLACGSRGALISLARILQPTPELGRITYILKEEV